MSRVTAALPEPLFGWLRKGSPAVLITLVAACAWWWEGCSSCSA